jgi:hypothetical protein
MRENIRYLSEWWSHFHPFSWKWHACYSLWLRFHCVYTAYFLFHLSMRGHCESCRDKHGCIDVPAVWTLVSSCTSEWCSWAMLTLPLVFWGSSTIIFPVPALIHSPSNSVQVHPPSLPAFVIFLITAILVEARWNLNALLICISLLAKDVEQFFFCNSSFHFHLYFFWELSI